MVSRTPEQAETLAHAKELNSHRGAVIGLWAGIESCLDQANHCGWRLSGRKISKAVPVGLRRKIKLFQLLHRELPSFVSLKHLAGGLLDTLELTFEERHWLAHGYYVVEESRDDYWVLRKHCFTDAGGIELSERRFSRDNLFDLQQKIIALATDMSMYLNALIGQVDKHTMDDQRR